MAATSFFRRNQRKLLGILVVFLMAIWGIGPAAEYLIPKPAVGNILGQKITQEEFSRTATRWARIFFRDAKEPVAQLVWKQMALFNQAEQMGITITADELAQEIRNFFPVDPRVFEDKEGFRRMLGSVFHLTELQFEETIKEYLLARKLQYLIRNSVKITEDEALRRFVKENEQVKVKYAALKARDFINQVEIEENEIKSFYDKHSGSFSNENEGVWGYKEPEKVKLEYIIAKNDTAEKQIEITEEKIKEYYEDKKGLMFKKESASAEVSENKDSDEAAVSEFKPLDEVRGQIKNNILLKERERIVNKLIADADNEIYEVIDKEEFISFSKLAEKYGLSHVIPTNSNNGTNYFTEEELKVVMMGLQQFPKQVFERDINDPSPPIDSVEGKLIFRVIEKIEPHVPPYEEIRDKVAEDLRYKKAFEKAEKFAEKCLEEINQTSFEEGIKSIEGEAGRLATIETKYINRPGIISKEDDTETLGQDRAKIVDAAFGLKVGGTAVAAEEKGEKTCYVVMLVDKRKVDPKKFEEDKDSIMRQYLMEKQLSFLSEWEIWISTKTKLGKSNS